MFTLWNRLFRSSSFLSFNRTFQSLSSKKKIYLIDRKHSVLDPKARISLVLALTNQVEQPEVSETPQQAQPIQPPLQTEAIVQHNFYKERIDVVRVMVTELLHRIGVAILSTNLLGIKITRKINKTFNRRAIFSGKKFKKAESILHKVVKTLRFVAPILFAYFMVVLQKSVVLVAQLLRLTGKLLWRFYRSSSAQEFFGKIGISGVVLSLILMGLLNYPSMLVRLFPDTYGETVVSALDSEKADHVVQVEESFVLPPKDESLSVENRLIIKKIGVDTEILEQPEKTYEEALKKGVWRIPDFANPEVNVKYPTILVAHRFGYLKWTNQFRKQNSFYNLDDLENGDQFEVIWDQRRYVYQIYAEQEGREITDYSADMILYTCKHLNSPIRIFRYAMRVSENEVASTE